VAKDTNPRRILFVDDEEGIRLTLPPILTGCGFAVTAVGSVSDALAQVSRKKYDVLVSDLNIHEPGDGFLVIAAMHLQQPECVNLVLTGYPALDTAVEGIREEIADYFVKPVEIEELVNAINLKLELKSRLSGRIKPSPNGRGRMPAPDNLRILVADDHEIIRRGNGLEVTRKMRNPSLPWAMHRVSTFA
jgi:DNA-binding NtrC family response regulator